MSQLEGAKKWSPPKGSLVSYLCCCSTAEAKAASHNSESDSDNPVQKSSGNPVHEKCEKVVKDLKLSKKEKKLVKMASKKLAEEQPVKRGAVAVPIDNG